MLQFLFSQALVLLVKALDAENLRLDPPAILGQTLDTIPYEDGVTSQEGISNEQEESYKQEDELTTQEEEAPFKQEEETIPPVKKTAASNCLETKAASN